MIASDLAAPMMPAVREFNTTMLAKRSAEVSS